MSEKNALLSLSVSNRLQDILESLELSFIFEEAWDS